MHDPTNLKYEPTRMRKDKPVSIDLIHVYVICLSVSLSLIGNVILLVASTPA